MPPPATAPTSPKPSSICQPRGLREGNDGALPGDAAPASCRPVAGEARKRLNAFNLDCSPRAEPVPFPHLCLASAAILPHIAPQPVRSMTGHASRSTVLLLAHMGGLPSQV